MKHTVSKTDKSKQNYLSVTRNSFTPVFMMACMCCFCNMC